MPQTRPLNVVLIHGTFAHDADWIQPDSPFSAALLAAIPSATIIPFRWSGTNSHAARIDAGKQLAAFLSELLNNHPDRRCVAVAHSHGGNVLLYALSDESARSALDSCVFLGTPFIVAKPRTLKPYIDLLSFQLTWLIIYVVVTAVAMLSFDEPANGWLLSTALLLFLIPITPHIPLRDRLNYAIEDKLAVSQRDFLESVRPPPLDLPALFCFVPGDEAQNWLQIVRATSQSIFRVNDYVRQFANTWPLFIVLLLVTGAVDWIIGERDAFLADAMLPVIGVMLAGLAAVALMALLIPLVSIIVRGHAAGFGWEGLLGFSLVDLYTEKFLPCGSGETAWGFESAPDPVGRGLKHSSFYTDTHLSRTVAQWLRSRSADEVRPLAYFQSSSDTPIETDDFTVLVRCLLFVLVVFLMGVGWSYWEKGRPVRDFPPGFEAARLTTKVSVCLTRFELVPYHVAPQCGMLIASLVAGEKRIWTFSLHPPPANLNCFLTGHFRSDSRLSTTFVGLERGPEDWGRPRRMAYQLWVKRVTTASGPDASFAKPVPFLDGAENQGCVILENYGKETIASITFDLSWTCVAK